MKKKKILYVITKSVWGGAQRYVFDLAVNMPKDEFDVAVITSGNGPLIEKLDLAGIRTIILPALQSKNGLFAVIFSLVNFSSLFELFKIFKNEGPDVIHLNSSKIGGLGAVAAKLSSFIIHHSSFVVFTVHGWGFKEDRPWASRAIIFFFSWLSAIFQNKIILINKADLESAKRFIPASKLALIYNGVKKTVFFTKDEAKKQISITSDEIIIGTIAELTKNKGLNYLIDAISRINAESPAFVKAMAGKQMPNTKCIVIGDGEDGEELQNRIISLGLQKSVFLAGFIPDAEKLLKAFDIFVLPSVKEGLPYVIIAAMQAGLPIIATNIGGIPDMIEHEKNGLLIRPKDPENLADAILDLVKNKEKRQTLGIEARKISETNFKLRDMVDGTIALYK